MLIDTYNAIYGMTGGHPSATVLTTLLAITSWNVGWYFAKWSYGNR